MHVDIGGLVVARNLGLVGDVGDREHLHAFGYLRGPIGTQSDNQHLLGKLFREERQSVEERLVVLERVRSEVLACDE